MVTKAMNTSEINTLTYKALPYTTGLPFLPFPTFVALSFTIFVFPPHLLFQITHPSLVLFLSSASSASVTTGSLCLLLYKELCPQGAGWLAPFFPSSLSHQLALGKGSISPTSCKKIMHTDSLFLLSRIHLTFLVCVYLAFFLFIKYILKDGRICLLQKPFWRPGDRNRNESLQESHSGVRQQIT